VAAGVSPRAVGRSVPRLTEGEKSANRRGLLDNAGQSEALARSVPDSGGVVFVPALTGLGAPDWDRAATTGNPKAPANAAMVPYLIMRFCEIIQNLRERNQA